MSDSLEACLRRVRKDPELRRTSEAGVSIAAVLPILNRLGWDTENISEVVPEYTVKNMRVDYCLKIADQRYVFIEVKRCSEELGQGGH